MQVRILDPAEKDIENGFRFYERQSSGLGSYFIDSLYSDIDSLAYYGGIHRVMFGYHRLLSRKIEFAEPANFKIKIYNHFGQKTETL